jgi:hypothetical protein
MQQHDCSQESAGIYPQQRLKGKKRGPYWIALDPRHTNINVRGAGMWTPKPLDCTGAEDGGQGKPDTKENKNNP